jgi:CBS domain containing-hemolysin-like protein
MNIFTSLANTEIANAVGWDSPASIAVQLAIIAGIVGLNGFFVAAEFSLVKLRSSQLEPLIDEGDRNAILARDVLKNLESYLSATQLGITMANLSLGWVGEPYMEHLMHPIFSALGLQGSKIAEAISFTVSFGIITFIVILLGELGPKYIAIRNPLKVALTCVKPLQWFYFLCKPAIWLLNKSSNLLLVRMLRIHPASESELAHSEEELRVILAESARAEEVTPMGKEILINALDLQKRVVRDITTPRGEVVFLNTEDTFEENLKRAMESRHTRFPLCRGHLDETIGLVHIKDLLKLVRSQEPKLESIKRDLHNVPEMMPLEKLLSFFLNKHVHIGLVVDEFGGTAGIVTLDNVLEEIVGDIQDEFDTEKPELRRVTQDEFVVDGTLGIYELNEMLGLELESADVSTVGGYITQVIGHLPRTGEKARIDEFEATVTKADGRRVLEVHFKRKSSTTSQI